MQIVFNGSMGRYRARKLFGVGCEAADKISVLIGGFSVYDAY
jgi:hypothetical protein